MPEAWMVRESQREDLVRSIMQKVYEEDDKCKDLGYSKTFLLDLAKRMTEYFIRRQEGLSSNLNYTGKLDRVGIFFNNHILFVISEFSRAPEEKEFMLVKLLKNIINTGLEGFLKELLCLEIAEPEKVFNTPSVTSEMPLEQWEG